MTKNRILLITDSIYSQSGVGNVAKQIVYKSVDKFDYLIIGAFDRTPNHGNKFDYSERISKETGVSSSVEEIQWNGYGTIQLFSDIIKREKFDAILLMSDPRHHLEFFNYQHVLSKLVPIIWYNIWDAEPSPHFNLPYYDSCDALINISELTHKVVLDVLGDKAKNKIVEHVPHGIDTNTFYEIKPDTKEYLDLQLFKKAFLAEKNPDYIFLFNSVNMQRKNIGLLLEAYKEFLVHNPKEKVCLILHTQPLGGTHIPEVIKQTFKGIDIKDKIILSQQRLDENQMRYLYNISDCIINTSFAEGWGLSLTEGMACGKPFIAPYHGGMKDQYKSAYSSDIVPKSYSIPVASETLTSSNEVPYIYQYYISRDDAYQAMEHSFLERKYKKSFYTYEDLVKSKFNSNDMVINITKIVNKAIENFVPTTNYTLTNA